MKALVVGNGLAGSICAARLRSLGADVDVIFDRPGATWCHGGGWYLGIHALSRLGLPTGRIGEALDFVTVGLPELGLEDGPFGLPDVEGATRVVDVAPATHARAATLPGPVGVVDLAPLGHPFAEMTTLAGAQRLDVRFPEGDGWFGRSFAAVAAHLEANPAAGEALTVALAGALAGRGCRSVLLPPVLGIASASARRTALEARLNLPVAEALDLLPSTPGLRLAEALARWGRDLGVGVRSARAEAVDPATLTVTGSDGTRWRADALILATGSLLSGGLVGASRPDEARPLREALADLRLWPDLPVNLMAAVNPSRPYGQGLFRAGVSIDARLRPTRPDGTPYAPALFAVGDLVGGPDGAKDRCATGRALLTGFLAAEHAAAALGLRVDARSGTPGPAGAEGAT